MSSPREVLERFYAAERLIMQGKAGFEAMAATLAEDVRLHPSPDLPFGGEYVGRAEYRSWADSMGKLFDRVDVQNAQFFEDGDTVVVVCTLVDEATSHPARAAVSHGAGRDGLGEQIVDFRPFYWNLPAYVAAASSQS